MDIIVKVISRKEFVATDKKFMMTLVLQVISPDDYLSETFSVVLSMSEWVKYPLNATFKLTEVKQV